MDRPRTTEQPIQVVWLKRDLRLRDHPPLFEAAERSASGGPALVVLYVYEPSLWTGSELNEAHLRFVNESLAELDRGLRARGAHLTFRVGEMPEVLAELHRELPIRALWSHRETGNELTFQRDLRVKEFCAGQGIGWIERGQHGVIRRLGSRDGWSSRWHRAMNRPAFPAPARFENVLGPETLEPERIRDATELGVPASTLVDTQPGGEHRALELLKSFHESRGVHYRSDMSSPTEGWEGCSRLSPHLAFGTISTRLVYQRNERRLETLKRKRAGDAGAWRDSLRSFRSRLSWQGHFMQKLESQPDIEFENMNRAFDGLREPHFDEGRYEAWTRGETGYPLVDACMRCVTTTGWLNFRMRAMLVSFSSYHLWLHWRRPAIWLGRHFLDFEPGIHFSQVQMQSGVTGMNTIRVYSPTKQVHDNDPEGIFIKRWVPELADVPRAHIAEPWKMTPLEQQAIGCVIGRDYPAPIVDHREAMAEAKRRIFSVRGTAEARALAQQIYQRHGSRRRPRRRPR